MIYFTIEELTHSSTATRLGVDNTPSTPHYENLIEMTDHLLDPLRDAWAGYCHSHHLGTPALQVTSGYRGFRLNQAVGGVPSSAHCYGLAVDLVPHNRQLKAFKIFCRQWLATRDFDQMISEKESADGTPRWIHLGYRHPSGRQRHQMLSMRKGKYIPQTA